MFTSVITSPHPNTELGVTDERYVNFRRMFEFTVTPTSRTPSPKNHHRLPLTLKIIPRTYI